MSITPKLQDDKLVTGVFERRYTVGSAGNGMSSITEDITALEQQGTPVTSSLLKNVGVVRCECVTSGTTHALTSENSGMNQISFVADANYSSSNTMTLNGNALAVQGGSFAAGDIVFALLDGNTINFKSGGTAPTWITGTFTNPNPSKFTTFHTNYRFLPELRLLQIDIDIRSSSANIGTTDALIYLTDISGIPVPATAQSYNGCVSTSSTLSGLGVTNANIVTDGSFRLVISAQMIVRGLLTIPITW